MEGAAGSDEQSSDQAVETPDGCVQPTVVVLTEVKPKLEGLATIALATLAGARTVAAQDGSLMLSQPIAAKPLTSAPPP